MTFIKKTYLKNNISWGKKLIRFAIVNSRPIIKNIYKTNYSKNVLISYITSPFKRNKIRHSHSNHQEVLDIADTFSSLKYNVDVCDYTLQRPINYNKYDIIFGFGDPFDTSFYHENRALKILFYTGAHAIYQNNAELERILKIRKRKGVFILPRRVIRYAWSASTVLSDYIISIGNAWTVSTLKQNYKGTIFPINVSAFNFFPQEELQRDWNLAKNNYLWIGSSGLVHKGLDLCIESLSNSKFNLHICGPMEDDFSEMYYKELYSSNNIFYHGFVDISSDKFKSIIKDCGFILYPSCSEGQSGSVITAMFTGLIPIVSRQTGVSCEKFGFYIDTLDVKTIYNICNYVSSLSFEDYQRKSLMSYEYCKRNHTKNIFKKNFLKIILNILNL